MEPGRSIAGPTGALVARVLYNKQQGDKRFAIVDAAMNDLIRPVLYDAHHPIVPVRQPQATTEAAVDVVGPICETGDVLARERPLPELREGELLAILQVGAYGFAMSSNYNGRLRAAEVLVGDGMYEVIRRRQTYEALLDGCL
jgi:diaminopimelate decarboxylase